MPNTVNYPLRTTPQIRAAAEALTNLGFIVDHPNGRYGAGWLSLETDSINSAFNSLMVLGMRRLVDTIEHQIAPEAEILRAFEAIMRHFLDNPEVRAVTSADFRHQALIDVLEYIEWVQSPDALNEESPKALSAEIQETLASRAGKLCNFNGNDRIDRQFVTYMLGGAQQQVFWLSEARNHLTAAINQAMRDAAACGAVTERAH